jgi:branched-chain amino acid transport system substrate-binding protein
MVEGATTMRRYGSRLLLAATLALVIALAAAASCGGDGGSEEDGVTPEGSPIEAGTPAAAGPILTVEDILRKDAGVTKAAEVEWGWMFEMSGPLQSFGEPTGDGVKLAVQEINDAGGFQVGDTIYTIKLLEHDTRSDISNTVAITTELVRDDGVNVIWGPASTGDPESTQITQAARVLHMCPCPSRELTSLQTVDQARGESHWAFQTIPAPSGFLKKGARDTAEKYPEYEKFATICVNTETGRKWCEMFEQAYQEFGFEHTGRELFPPGTDDFSPYLTKLREADPDMILNFEDSAAQFSLLRQSWELDVGQFYIASVALPYDLFETLVGGEGIRSKIVSVGGTPRAALNYTSEKARSFFEEKYRAYKGGTLPLAAFGALLTYDQVYMLAAAMQRAGTVEDTDKIIEALEQVHFNGVGEDDLYFNERHIYVAGNDACTITGGRYTECFHVPPQTEEAP